MACSMELEYQNKKMLEYTESIRKKGDELLANKIPAKIELLTNMMRNDTLQNMSLSDIHSIANTTNVRIGKRKYSCLDENYYSGNKIIAKLTDVVKPHIRQLVEDCNLLKMWVLYKMPKAELGHNFGVSIQELALAKAQTYEQETAAFYDQINKYYSSRGKLLSKVYKSPEVEDYRCAIRELDEVQYLSLCLILKEIRNRYCNVHDFIVKNLEKIECPRNATLNESLY